MHKLQAIAGALMGAGLALGVIGYVQGIVTGGELIALIVALIGSTVADHYLAKAGQ